MSKASKCEIITIDGPAGVGKGTISRLLARSFGYSILDSGLIYRLVASYIFNQQFDIENINEDWLFHKLSALNICFKTTNFFTKIYLNEIDITNNLREEKIGNIASKIAKISVIRNALLLYQKSFANIANGLVADGRDMGSIVFPDAKYKFFLDADVNIRAKRRYKDLAANAVTNPNYSTVLSQLKIRDFRDRNRDIAPLKPAHDAFIIDTGKLSIEEVHNKVKSIINTNHVIFSS